MIRVVYLFGVSGSGKGHIAKQLSALRQGGIVPLEVDHVHRPAAQQLGPGDPRALDDWCRWDDHLRAFDVPATLTEILVERWPQVSEAQRILAEGIMLGHQAWREAFRNALRRAGVNLDAERVFWIDPPPEKVMEYRRKRGRENQRNETIADVNNHLESYRSQVRSDNVCLSSSVDETISTIAEFMGMGDTGR